MKIFGSVLTTLAVMVTNPFAGGDTLAPDQMPPDGRVAKVALLALSSLYVAEQHPMPPGPCLGLGIPAAWLAGRWVRGLMDEADG